MTGNLSLERGLAILRVLKATDEAVGVRQIARSLDLSAAAVQRLLNTLAGAGYVEQVAETRRYRIGYAALALADRALRQDRLIAAAEGELRGLASNEAFNGFLGVRRDRSAVYLLCIQSRSPIVIRATPGETMHLHATALGKALLLDMEEDEVSALFQDHPLDRVTENTVVDVAKLTAQIRTARTVGYTTAFNENIAGVVSVGAPIRNAAARVHAAISIAVPRAIYPKIDIAEAGEIVAAAAKRISAQLGWEPAPARRGQLA